MGDRNDLFRQIKAIKKKVQRSEEKVKKFHYCDRDILIQEDPDGGVGGSLWEAVCLNFTE